MNIFALDNDPEIAASYLCDKHVPKMLLESAQLLSTLARSELGDEICDERGLYKATHQKHPCQLWLRESTSNWAWLWCYVVWLNAEYRLRFNSTADHKSRSIAWQAVILLKRKYLREQPLEWDNHTEFVQCMPEQYCVEGDPVAAYRKYYVHEKRHFARWKRGTPQPEWFTTQVKELLCSAPNATARQLKLHA